MSKGYQENQERRQALSMLGKELARRSKSRCEICEASGERLNIFEVPPVPKEPDVGHCILVCDTCHETLKKGIGLDHERWRCLGEALWSETPAVQVTAIRLLKRLSGKQLWAREFLETHDPEPDIEAWALKEP